MRSLGRLQRHLNNFEFSKCVNTSFLIEIIPYHLVDPVLKILGEYEAQYKLYSLSKYL